MKNPYDPLIFIIDKNPVYRKILKNSLGAINYHNIYTFESSEECLETNMVADIVVLDHEMGENRQTGLEFMRLFQLKNRNTHFIFLSSNTNIEIAVDAIKFGAYDYIIKSKLGLHRLISRLDKLVNSQLQKRKQIWNFRTAFFSLGMLSFLFVIIQFIYNK